MEPKTINLMITASSSPSATASRSNISWIPSPDRGFTVSENSEWHAARAAGQSIPAIERARGAAASVSDFLPA
jgi:hypothetical protein